MEMSTFRVLLEDEAEKKLFLAAVEYTELKSQDGVNFSCDIYGVRTGWFVATLTATHLEADTTLRQILFGEASFSRWRNEILEVKKERN